MAAQTIRPAEIDFGDPLPPIRPLHGINFGPRYNGRVDLSDLFRRAGFPSYRLHDCPLVCKDTVDIHYLFPLFHLDEQDPASWIFGPTDDYVAAIKNIGGDIIYRLGPTIEHQTPKYFIHPPADYDKWARICCQVIRHYNEGWANGYRYNIAYWEIWNEPWHPSMWTGTTEEWFRLYEVASKAIKSEFPGLKVGGADALGDYADAFLSHCREHDCPVDFFTWHIYAQTPKAIVDGTREAEALLEKHGYGGAEINLNEWNWFPEKDWSWRLDASRTRLFHEGLASAKAAAFAAATLSFLQDERMDMANWYAPFLGKWGMFDPFARPFKPYYAFQAFNAMMKTPRRVRSRGEDLDAGLSLLAGLAPDGRRAQVLLSNFAADEVPELRLTLKNLPQDRWHCDEYLLDDALDLQPVKAGAVTGGAELAVAVPPASVRLLDLRAD